MIYSLLPIHVSFINKNAILRSKTCKSTRTFIHFMNRMTYNHQLNHKSSNNFIKSSNSINILTLGSGDIDLLETKEKDQFQQYYRNLIQLPQKEITFNQLIQYSTIENLLQDGLVMKDDLMALWTSSVGDANGLNEAEAFEFVCMVTDLPDPEDIQYYKDSFQKLIDIKTKTLSFAKFINWNDIQDMINADAISMDDIATLWKEVAKDLKTNIDETNFIKLNAKLDDMLDTINEEEEEDNGDINVWDESFVPETAFELVALKEIREFWNLNSIAPAKEFLTKTSFFQWKDIIEILDEGVVKQQDLEDAWNIATNNGNQINFDKFLRLNVFIDLLLDDKEESSDASNQDTNEDDPEGFYKSVFSELANKKSVLSLSDLLKWDELQDLIDESIVSTKQLIALFDSLPKDTDGDVSGISEASFLTLNSMLDVMVDKTDGKSKSTSSSLPLNTPKSLVSTESRPLPKDAELKIGSLGNADMEKNDDETAELTGEELELLQALDKADSLLNTGSFNDYDTLIGDQDDPRLVNARSILADTIPLNSEVNEIIRNLISLSSEQKRCGIDQPNEQDEVILRDLSQGIIDKSVKLASKDINTIRNLLVGKWKLLYTNSEMFSFYNGVTGFANVFPGAKFQDISLEYLSDGYLNEAKYLENLNTPLGNTLATVYCNWDLLKETSYITNENSVILRSYCTKVTAGPMTYRAEENWKSLRTLAMNELVYIDSDFMLMRNAGALRVYFVLVKEKL